MLGFPQTSETALQRTGDTGVSPGGWMVKTRALTHPPVLQTMSPLGSMGSCTSSSTLPRASSSQPVSVGTCPRVQGLGRELGPACGPALSQCATVWQ